MYPCNLSALPIKTNGAFPLLCCDKIEHNEWHLESAKLQAASRSYHVLLLQCHLLTFFTKQNVYLICSFLRMHLLKSRSPGGGVAYIYIYVDICICIYIDTCFNQFNRIWSINSIILQGSIGCTPNIVPMVFIVFSQDSWESKPQSIPTFVGP